jgi:hypothetical protein
VETGTAWADFKTAMKRRADLTLLYTAWFRLAPVERLYRVNITINHPFRANDHVAATLVPSAIS